MKEIKEIKETKEFRIPIVYKDFGRARGCDQSALALYDIINSVVENELKVHTNIKIIPEMVNVKKLTGKKFKDSNNDILFKFCTIQTPSQRGTWELVANEKDICWAKNTKDGYIQAKQPAQYIEGTSSPKKYFPKYFGLGTSIKRSIVFKKPVVNVGWYDRNDTCPKQSSVYKTFSGILLSKYSKNVSISKIGYNSDLSKREMKKYFNGLDVMLYTLPSHLDIWPNTIFHAIEAGVKICFIQDGKQMENPDFTNGIYELKQLFPNSFINNYELSEIVKNKSDKTIKNKIYHEIDLEEINYGVDLLTQYTRKKIYDKIVDELYKLGLIK